MRFISTRGGAPAVTLSEAIRAGAAPDGGLYLPDRVPTGDPPSPDRDLPGYAADFLRPFFGEDPLAPRLDALCARAFAAPIPAPAPVPGRRGLKVLELFHGPTGAFKDFGARFLMGCFDALGDPANPLTVLAATSGDTGGAVGCAAEGRDAVRAVILFPKGRVSPFQELQLTCWGEPVQAVEVDGDFDDCQRLVKAAFADAALSERHRLTSANSINLGRLLPQMAYLAWGAAQVFAETGTRPGLIVPTGNLGHGFAALYARVMGAPIGPVVLATNANRTLADWHATGRYEARPSIATLANAMDVGAPSNFERLAALPELGEVIVELVDDGAIRARIRADDQAGGTVWCPHSATAAVAFSRLPDEVRDARPWIAAATAHPFKFAESVEPVIGRRIEPPRKLAEILGREAHKRTISATLDALADALEESTSVVG